MSDQLYMMQTWVDGKQLTEVGKMLGLPLRQADNNYLAHCLLGEVFGDDAPKPFWLNEDPDRETKRKMRVLGYTEATAEDIQEYAKAVANPSLYDGVDWEKTATKPMPGSFPDGMRLGFELRACPVIRKSSDGPNWEEGQEVDAFLDRVWEVDDETVNIEREEVYRDWLVRQFDIRGGATPVEESIGLKRFSLEQMIRRAHGGNRTTKTIRRPDATLTGELEVTDGDTFRDLVESGIGRHKSFGFGMLKVKPA